MSGNLVGPNGEPVGGRTMTYREWVGGENASKYATREQVVAFWNLALREQIVPLIRNAIERYDAEQRANRWHRRLARWLRGRLRFGRPRSREEAVRILTDIDRQRMAPLLSLEQHVPEDDGDG